MGKNKVKGDRGEESRQVKKSRSMKPCAALPATTRRAQLMDEHKRCVS